MVNIALVIITDGRLDYLMDTLESFQKHVDFKFGSKFIINDQGDTTSHEYLKTKYEPLGFQIESHKARLGLTQTVRDAWKIVPQDTEFVFHQEDDFTYNQDVDIELLSEILKCRSNLTQVILKRQAWSFEEIQVGGFIELDPAAYEEHGFMISDTLWTEHRKFFSLNPCLIPKWVTDLGWDDEDERGFSQRLFQDPDARAGVFGAKLAPPVVHHIGVNRTHEGGDHGYGKPLSS